MVGLLLQPYSVEQVDSATLDGLDSILEAETTLQQPQPNVFGATAAGGSGLGNTGAIMGQQVSLVMTRASVVIQQVRGCIPFYLS